MATHFGRCNRRHRRTPHKGNVAVRLFRNYYVRKLFKALFTIWVVITLIFFMVRMLPGNPIDQYVNQMVTTYGMDVQQARSRAAALFAIDLDAPVWQQYLDYLWTLSHLDLGKSLTSPGTPVSSIIMRFLPWTIFAVGTGDPQFHLWHPAGPLDGAPSRWLLRPQPDRLCLGHQRSRTT